MAEGGTGINGLAVGAMFVGAVLVYSGVRGKGVGASFRAMVLGNDPTTLPTAYPIAPGDQQAYYLNAPGGTGTTPTSSGSTPVYTNTPLGSTNFGTIYNFFHSKGLTLPQIAGIMGNIKTESNGSPTAYNPNEGAIGLAQWEGGRRTALQAYAAAHGTTETDLMTQLNFYWQELTGSYSGAYMNLRASTTAQQAATVIQSQYEVSAPGSLPDRINNAVNFLSQMLGGGFA